MANHLALAPSGDDGQGGRPDNHDELGVELEAMATIGRALDSIEDPALRQRILNWAVERWGEQQSLVSNAGETPARPASSGIASDPALAVDSIDDLFTDGAVEARPGKPPEILVPEKPAKAPVESMLQSLAADFQRLADEWNGA